MLSWLKRNKHLQHSLSQHDCIRAQCPINRQKPRATFMYRVYLANINPCQFSWLGQTTKTKRRKAVFLLCVPNDRFAIILEQSSSKHCRRNQWREGKGGGGRIGMRYFGTRLMHCPVDRYTDNKMSLRTYQCIPQIQTGHLNRLNASIADADRKSQSKLRPLKHKAREQVVPLRPQARNSHPPEQTPPEVSGLFAFATSPADPYSPQQNAFACCLPRH
jgi:hypothetical protein